MVFVVCLTQIIVSYPIDFISFNDVYVFVHDCIQVRATNLQELVYKNGQAGVSKATVSVVFDNTDKKQSPLGYEQYDEITVTRQVFAEYPFCLAIIVYNVVHLKTFILTSAHYHYSYSVFSGSYWWSQ